MKRKSGHHELHSVLPSRRVFMRTMTGAAGMAMLGGSLSLPESGVSRTSDARATAVVLGSAQDGGVPHTACHKAHCEAARANPALRRRSPCLAVLDHEEKKAFALDAGPDFDEQLESFPAEWKRGRNPLDGILLTHAHVGHYTGLMYLGRAIAGVDNLPVYCSPQMADFLKNNGPWSLMVELKNIELHPITPGTPVSLSRNIAVEAIAVPHRAEYTDTYAYIVHGPDKKLLFLPDIDRWDGLQPDIEQLVASMDISLLDGTFYSPDELPGRDMSTIPHPMITDSVARLRDVVSGGKKRVVFIHLNHSNLLLDEDGKRLADLRAQGFDIAFDGMELDL